MSRALCTSALLLPPILIALLYLSKQPQTFEICNDGCTLLNLHHATFLVATQTALTILKYPRFRVSFDTAWLGPFRMRFVSRSGLLFVYPCLTFSLALAVFILYARVLRTSAKHRIACALRATTALLLVVVAHSDFHAFILASDFHGYNTHIPRQASPLPPEWMRASFNCSEHSFPSFGNFVPIARGTAPCLLYKFHGTVGLDVTDCDTVMIEDGPDKSYKPYGAFWKRAIFLKEASQAKCMESGRYTQWLYSDNDNVLEYFYQDNMTDAYNAVRRDYYGTGLSAVTIAPGHSANILNFSTEWLSYHDHELVVGKGIHDLTPFREHLGQLNAFPGAINEAVELKARHCARHTLNRNRCVRGGNALPNVELQVLNDVMHLQLITSAFEQVFGGLPLAIVTSAVTGKADSILRTGLFAARLVFLSLILNLQLGATIPQLNFASLKHTNFKVCVGGRLHWISMNGVAFRDMRMLSGNQANGFVSFFDGVGSCMAFAAACVMFAFGLARLLKTRCIWCYDLFVLEAAGGCEVKRWGRERVCGLAGEEHAQNVAQVRSR